MRLVRHAKRDRWNGRHLDKSQVLEEVASGSSSAKGRIMVGGLAPRPEVTIMIRPKKNMISPARARGQTPRGAVRAGRKIRLLLSVQSGAGKGWLLPAFFASGGKLPI